MPKPKGTKHVRLLRWMRRVGRVLLALSVVIGMLFSTAAPAAAALARMAVRTCSCPHGDSERKSCRCCNHDDAGGDHCLPVGGTCGASVALAPPAMGGDLVPLPLLTGIAASLEVAPLLGRLDRLRLERPPRG